MTSNSHAKPQISGGHEGIRAIEMSENTRQNNGISKSPTPSGRKKAGGALRRDRLEWRRSGNSAQRTTRAPPPFMSFSTSFCVAMEVSPGVVLANAPWAAP